MKKRSKKTRATASSNGVDGEGLQRAMLAALGRVYQSSPHLTLPQLLVAMEVALAEREGTPHTLASLVRKLDMPFSTASRVVWSLTREGGDIGAVKYVAHPTDRRKKLLALDAKGIDRAIARAMIREMTDYYGDSLRRLRSV